VLLRWHISDDIRKSKQLKHTFGSLLIVGTWKFAIVDTPRLATKAVGALLRDLAIGANGWNAFERVIMYGGMRWNEGQLLLLSRSFRRYEVLKAIADEVDAEAGSYGYGYRRSLLIGRMTSPRLAWPKSVSQHRIGRANAVHIHVWNRSNAFAYNFGI
jgi:hypothetical protein